MLEFYPGITRLELPINLILAIVAAIFPIRNYVLHFLQGYNPH